MAEIKGNALSGIRCSIIPGRGNYHFRLSGCDDCNVRDLKTKTLEQVESLHHEGRIGQAMYEAYTHVWATNSVRFGNYLPWKVKPSDPEVIALVEMFRIL